LIQSLLKTGDIEKINKFVNENKNDENIKQQVKNLLKKIEVLKKEKKEQADKLFESGSKQDIENFLKLYENNNSLNLSSQIQKLRKKLSASQKLEQHAKRILNPKISEIQKQNIIKKNPHLVETVQKLNFSQQQKKKIIQTINNITENQYNKDMEKKIFPIRFSWKKLSKLLQTETNIPDEWKTKIGDMINNLKNTELQKKKQQEQKKIEGTDKDKEINDLLQSALQKSQQQKKNYNKHLQLYKTNIANFDTPEENSNISDIYQKTVKNENIRNADRNTQQQQKITLKYNIHRLEESITDPDKHDENKKLYNTIFSKVMKNHQDPSFIPIIENNPEMVNDCNVSTFIEYFIKNVDSKKDNEELQRQLAFLWRTETIKNFFETFIRDTRNNNVVKSNYKIVSEDLTNAKIINILVEITTRKAKDIVHAFPKIELEVLNNILEVYSITNDVNQEYEEIQNIITSLNIGDDQSKIGELLDIINVKWRPFNEV
jgi:hypothetical protein